MKFLRVREFRKVLSAHLLYRLSLVYERYHKGGALIVLGEKGCFSLYVKLAAFVTELMKYFIGVIDL